VNRVQSLAPNDLAAARIDCRWQDEVPYDTASAPSFGNMMLGVRRRAWAEGGAGLAALRLMPQQTIGKRPAVCSSSLVACRHVPCSL
jgi:hypothetical protein